MIPDPKDTYSPMEQRDPNGSSIGNIEISSEVIGAIASLAAQKIDGVVVVSSSFSLSDIFGGKEGPKGVDVKLDGESGHVVLNLDINVRYGIPIYQAAHDLQVLIKEEVEAMTGSMNVDKIHVRVKHLIMPDDTLLEREIVRPDMALDSRVKETKLIEE